MTRDTSDLSGAWALDALTPEERAEFEARLAQDSEARVEAIELADTAVELGLTVPEVAPPAELRARILELVDGRAQDAAEVRSTAGTADTHAAHRSVEDPPAARRRRLTPRSAFALAASVLLLSGLAVGGVGLQNALVSSTSNQAISRVEQAPDARTARASFTSGSGSAVLTWSTARDRSVLAVEHASAVAADRVYQLWYLDGAVARPAGTFTVDGSGDATVALQGSLKRGESVGVTVEPKGGSQHPTTPTVVVIQMA